MNAKQLKFLQLFEKLCGIEYLKNEKELSQSVKSFINLDYALAVDVWEYLCCQGEADIAKDAAVAKLLGETVFNVFFDKASAKCVKAVLDSAPIRRAVYQYAAAAATGARFNAIVDLLAAGKTADAEEIFKCLVKNERIHYGKLLKSVIEQLFVEILKKSASKKVEMSRKQITLLTSYIAKVKTDEKAMLEQRIREIQ